MSLSRKRKKVSKRPRINDVSLFFCPLAESYRWFASIHDTIAVPHADFINTAKYGEI